MGVVVSYDVSDKNPQMKQAMIDKGYFDSWKEGEVVVNLPNTTMWKKDGTVGSGLQDMKDAARSLNIQLERAVALPDDPTASITGDSHR